MKNYAYGWQIKERNHEEVSVEKYTEYQWETYEFITGVLNNAIKAAKCGWAGVTYKVLSFENDTREYMILYSNGDVNRNYSASRWIPIDGNSKGCNFAVLGENLW